MPVVSPVLCFALEYIGTSLTLSGTSNQSFNSHLQSPYQSKGMGIIWQRVSQIWPICGTGVGKLDDDTELNCMGPL